MIRIAASLLVLLWVCAAPVSAQTARLLVRVIDRPTGAPIPDVRVQIFREDPPPATRARIPIPTKTLIASAQTDALGTAVISVKASVYYYIRATHKQYLPTDDDFHRIRPSEGDVAVGLNLFPADFILPPADGQRLEIVQGRLVGRVSSPTGEGLSNIPVMAQQLENAGTSASTRTADDGSYSLALNPGTYTILAGGDLAPPISKWSSRDYTVYPRNDQTTARVVSGRRTRADIVLNPLRSFNVTVLVIDDLGQRVSNANVHALIERGYSTAMPERVTGEDGSAKIGPTTPGKVELLVHATKDERYLIGKGTIEIHDRPLTVTMSLVPSGIITGRVEFMGRLDPLHNPAGLRVTPIVSGRSNPTHVITVRPGAPGEVTASGEFKVVHLLGGHCLRLEGIPAGWRFVDVTYNGQDYTNRAFQLEAGQILDGVLIRVEPGPFQYSRPVCAQ